MMRKIIFPIGIVLMGCLPLSEVQAAPAGEQSLDSVAVKASDGTIKVLGTEGSWNSNPKTEKKSVFDRDSETFFDPESDGWAGFQVTAKMIPTRLTYTGRPKVGNENYPRRMKGCLFQGANTSDFANPVTLHTANPPDNWNGTDPITIELSIPYRQSFLYFRIVSNPTGTLQEGKFCGNASEVEFFGIPDEGEAPEAPSLEDVTQLNRFVSLSFPKKERARYYRIEKKFAYQTEEAFRPVQSFEDSSTSGGRIVFKDPQQLQRKSVYRVAAFITEEKHSAWIEHTIEPDINVLSGRVIGTSGSYNNLGNTRDHAFDGDPNSAVDVGLEGGAWVGLDLGSKQAITGIRFIPRPGNAGRLKNGQFQISEQEDFSDARVLYQIPESDPIETKILFEKPYLKGRYIRFKSAVDYCNVNEIEFLGEGNPTLPPVGLKARLADREKGNVSLTWEIPNAVVFNRTLIEQATAPGGPWTTVTPLGLDPDVTEWSDTTNALPIVKYYYRARFVNVDPSNGDGVKIGDPSNRVTWRRTSWLERTPSAPTALKEGTSLVYQGTLHHPGGGNEAEGPWENGFDNDPETFISGNEEGGRIGIQFDKPYRIALVRVMPRNSGDHGVGRLNGAEIWGSLDGIEGGRKLNGGGPISGAAKQNFSHLQIDEEESFNTVFLKKDSNFFCNLSEMEIYGWDPADEPKDILLAPTNVTLTAEENGIRVSWTKGENAEYYQVQRTIAGEEDWITVVEHEAGLNTLDSRADLDIHYLYRVCAVKKGSQAWTDNFNWFYKSGTGEGLYATFIQPHNPGNFNPDENIVEERIEETINFNRTSDSFFTGNNISLYAIWNGRLITPREGRYTFRMKHDDGAALWIDHQSVINVKWDGYKDGNWRTGEIELTKGEHPIRIDYYGAGAPDSCQLKWKGPSIEEDFIPKTQLIPLKPSLPKEWLGERTLNLPKKGHTSFNGDGSILMQGGGRDIWAGDEGFHYLWTTVKGNFEAEMKYTYRSENNTQGIKIMIMARSALTIGRTPFYAPAAQKTGTQFKYSGVTRKTPEAAIENLALSEGGWDVGGGMSGWLKLQRKDNTFRSFWKGNESDDWVEIGKPIPMGDGTFGPEIFIGPAITTNNDQPVEKVEVSDFRINKLGTLMILQ